MPEEEKEHVRASLMEIREKYEWDDPDVEDFYVWNSGGNWCAANLHTAANAANGKARGGVADKWARCSGWGGTIMYTYTEYDGPGNANGLAREWCRRAEYFFSVIHGVITSRR